MNQSIIHITDSEIIRLGKDEMNLIEHPFGSLSKEKDTRNIELHWKTQHPLSKRVLDAYWKVRGDANLGLPTANDEKVYLVAMELTRESSWKREVHFTRADFLRRLSWTDNDEAYRRLHEAFLRLAGVLIEAKNAFYHPKSGHYIDGGFHLIDTFMIAGEGPGRKSRERLNQPLTYFVWNKIVHESFIAGNIRSLDLEFALSLERPLSLRLFRYLDKKRHGGRQHFEVGLRELCGVHLGMVIESRFDSNLKASLKAAHAELMARGFLTQATYEKMKTRKGLKVIYTFASTAFSLSEEDEAIDSRLLIEESAEEKSVEESEESAEEAPTQLQLLLPEAVPSLFAAPDTGAEQRPLDDTNDSQRGSLSSEISPSASLQESVERPESTTSATGDLKEKLQARGVCAAVAQELCEGFSSAQIELQLNCLDDRNPKNPAAALVKSIRQGWNLPSSYAERQQDEAREKRERKARRDAEHLNRLQKGFEQERQQSHEAEMRDLDALWDKLDASTRESIESTARQRMGILGQSGRAAGALSAMRRTLLREMSSKMNAK